MMNMMNGKNMTSLLRNVILIVGLIVVANVMSLHSVGINRDQTKLKPNWRRPATSSALFGSGCLY